MNGERDILGIWAGDGGEGAKFWLGVLTEVKNRGVADVCIAVCDGLKGLPDAINTVWALATVQQCIIHLIAQHVPLRVQEVLGPNRFRPQTGLHRGVGTRSQAADGGVLARRGAPRTRRSPSCGPRRGPSSSPSWTTSGAGSGQRMRGNRRGGSLLSTLPAGGRVFTLQFSKNGKPFS